jgi:hypothetical protein
MAISAVLMRRLNEFLSSKTGNSFLPRGTRTPFNDFISTITASEKRKITLVICVWTASSCLSVAVELWLAAMFETAAQRRMHAADEIKRGMGILNGGARLRTNRKIAPFTMKQDSGPKFHAWNPVWL